MTKHILDMQTILNKQSDLQSDRVLLFGQVIEKKGNAIPSHFFRFLLTSSTNDIFDFALTAQAETRAKPKESFFSHRTDKMYKFKVWQSNNKSIITTSKIR